MKNVLQNETCDQSRRKVLKKAYVAPVVVALGAMTLSSPAEAMSSKGGGSSSAGNGSRSSKQKRSTERNQANNGSSSLQQYDR